MNKRNLLSLKWHEVKNFLIKQESYINLGLPAYFDFSELLSATSIELENKPLSDFQSTKPKEIEGLNYTLLCNKDGKYSWRPLQIIHPAIYVSMVQKIARYDNWKFITKRF